MIWLMSFSSEHQEPFTRGQAACYTYGAPINRKNGEAIKRDIEKRGYDVVWATATNGQNHPFLMGEGAIERNPLVYRRYNDTPPPVDVGLQLSATHPVELWRAAIPSDAGSVSSPSVPFAGPSAPIASQMSYAGLSSPSSHMSADVPRSPAAYPTTPIASQMSFDGPNSPLESQMAADVLSSPAFSPNTPLAIQMSLVGPISRFASPMAATAPSSPAFSPNTPHAIKMPLAGPRSRFASPTTATAPSSSVFSPTTPIASQMSFSGPSSPLASQSTSVPGPSSSVAGPSLSVTSPSTTVAGPSTTDAVQLPTDVVATPNSIIALLRVAISVDKPHNEAQYQHLDITPEVIRQILVKYLPSAFPKFAMKRIMQLIGYDPDLPNLNKSDRKRMGWLLNESALNSLVRNLFNLSQYQAKARSEQDWETIGYARKSVKHEDNYSELAQEIVDGLRIKLCCEKVYISMKCPPKSPLLDRDRQLTDERKRIADDLRHFQGHMQEFIAYAINAKKNIRLVFPDYAGLSTDGTDVRKFLNRLPQIKELAIDHGFHVQVLTRHQILQDNAIQDLFTNCRKGALARGRLVSLHSA